ncbi:hypothetical protein Taro_002223 [Colocasia esculenta]|uniref:Uncharacterized protein n=1 Tax=Colocasia esculenta TaxID=4460 RepID=A0A843TKA3_COLES|nr:hypothetical protein [Colocasia esculenta]
MGTLRRSTPTYCLSSDSLDYANRWRSPHAETASHIDQKSCSTRCEIFSPGRGYGCPNIADIPTISPIPKFFGSSDSLDYANRWRSPHAELPSHSDRKSCSTRWEISSPAIRNRHSETVNKTLVSRNSVPGPKSLPERRLPRLRESLAEPTRGAAQSHRSEVVFNSTRDFLPRSWIWVPEHRRYSHTLRFIPTPSAKELDITFCTGIEIPYVTTIRNRHSETVGKALVSRNSVPGPKSDPECVSWIWVPEHRRYSHPLRFIPTPSAKELSITFRTGIGIAYVTTIRNRHFETVDKALVSRNSIPEPKSHPERRLPRLRESLAEPTRGAAQSHRSEVVFNSTRDFLPRSWIWVPEHRRYSHTLRFIPNPSAKELDITFRTGIGIPYVTTIRNRHSETVGKALVSRNSVSGPKSDPECIGIAYVATIWNRHSETVDKALVSHNSVPGPKSHTERVSDSLDYENRWWIPHAEPPSHIDRKSCSTRCEISSPGRGYRIAYVTTIRNRHSQAVENALVSQNSVPGPKSNPERVSDSLDYANRWWIPARDLLPRSWIWVPEHRRYSHPLRFIPTPSVKELGITFRTGIGIPYVTTIQNRQSETVDKVLVSRNFVLGPKSDPERVSDSLEYANHWRSSHAEPPSHIDRKSCSTRREISSPGIGIAYVATIRNRHSETVDKALVSHNSVPGPKSHTERVSDSLDYENRWWIPHAEPPSHIDRKSCSTRCEISSPGIGIAYVTTIRNRHSAAVEKALVSQNSVPEPKSNPESVSDSLDYANHWRSAHAEPPSHIDRKSCSTRREISSPGIGIAYVTTIRNRHSEMVDKVLVSRNSVPGPKSHTERVSDSLDYENRWWIPHAEPPSHIDRKSCSTRCEISSPGRGYGCPNIADINRHSQAVENALVSQNSVPGPKSDPECVY